MLGKENPAAYAAYTQKFCFRALIPMDKARDAIGIYKTSTRFMVSNSGDKTPPSGHRISAILFGKKCILPELTP